MKKIIFLLIGFIIIGCKSQQFKLETESDLSLKEGNFTVIPAPIKEGKSKVKAHMILNDFDPNIKLIGFYFRDKFVEYKDNNNPYVLEGSVEISDSKTESPFELEQNEVVVSYNQNKKKKFVKFKLKKKMNSLNNIPMENNN